MEIDKKYVIDAINNVDRTELDKQIRDCSRETGHIAYTDCQECIHEFGNKPCLDCSYYESCMVENEIAEMELAHDRALERFYDRLENEEYPIGF